MGSATTKIQAGLSEIDRRVPNLIATVLGIYAAIVVFQTMFETPVLAAVLAPIIAFALTTIGWFPAILLHEAGHAVAAHVLGWRVWMFCVGPMVVTFHPTPKVSWTSKFARDVGGFVLPTPASAESDTKARDILISAAGPIASIGGAMLAYTVALALQDDQGAAHFIAGLLIAFAASSLACGVLSAWPHTFGADKRGNDALSVLRKFDEKRVEHVRVFSNAYGLLEHGIGQDDWDDWLIRYRDRDMQSATPSPLSRALMFLAALDRDDDAAACAIADSPEDQSRGAMSYLRAWSDGCIRGDFAAADAHLSRATGAEVAATWLFQIRDMAMIGVLAAAGERAWARQRMYRLERALRDAPAPNEAIKRALQRAQAGALGAVLAERPTSDSAAES